MEDKFAATPIAEVFKGKKVESFLCGPRQMQCFYDDDASCKPSAPWAEWAGRARSKPTATPVFAETRTAAQQVAVFGVPGAFTGVCSKRHVPGYVDKADALKKLGVDKVTTSIFASSRAGPTRRKARHEERPSPDGSRVRRKQLVERPSIASSLIAASAPLCLVFPRLCAFLSTTPTRCGLGERPSSWTPQRWSCWPTRGRCLRARWGWRCGGARPAFPACLD